MKEYLCHQTNTAPEGAYYSNLFPKQTCYMRFINLQLKNLAFDGFFRVYCFVSTELPDWPPRTIIEVLGRYGGKQDSDKIY